MRSNLVRNQTQNTENREAILSAALQLFTRHGYDATPVPEIARLAGISPGTIYRYFESKAELVNVLYRHWKTVFSDYLTKEFPHSAGARARFGHLFYGMVRFHADHPIAFHFLEIHHHVYLDEQSREVYAEVMRFLTGFLEETRAARITRPLPAVAIVAMILGAFTGMVKAAEQDQFILSPEVIAETEQACWAAIAIEFHRNEDGQSGIERIQS